MLKEYYLILLIVWIIDCKILFFKDLSSQKPYSANHLYRTVDFVSHKDSIMHLPNTDYVLISTSNSVVKIDIKSMDVLYELKVDKDKTYPLCFKDKYAEEYPCHLFGYWTKLIASTSASDNHQLFICLNNGQAVYYNVKTFDQIAYSPSPCPVYSVVSFISKDSNLYACDLKSGPKIYRFSPEYPKNNSISKKLTLSTLLDSSWIQQNDYLQFIYIFESGDFVYILFREIADEDSMLCHSKNVKSRIVRLKKTDTGGTPYKLKTNLISFVKATIICPDQLENVQDSSFKFLENAYFDIERQILYATFSTGESAVPSTVICQYSMNDIDTSFEGPYMNIKDPVNPFPKTDTMCRNPDSKDCLVHLVSNYQLKFLPVLPTSKNKLLSQPNEIWMHIQMMSIHRSSRQYNILFLASSKGEIKKYYQKLTDNTLCYSETLILSSDSNNQSVSIRDMKLVNSKSLSQPFLIVTVNTGVYKIAIEHCTIHSLKSSCIDPFCFWDYQSSTCTSIYTITVSELRQIPELTDCSDGSELQSPIWEQWSSWENCGNGNQCQCRRRKCKPGVCVNIEDTSDNSEIQVKNCTDHQQWSTWTDWSACNSKCGYGTSERQRWCSQNGNCPGNGNESKICFENSECKISESETVWGEWSKCSSNCGSGVITRTRKCQHSDDSTNPPNRKCELLDFKSCTGTDCQEITELSPVGKLMTETGENYFLASCFGNSGDLKQNKMVVSVEYDVMYYSEISHFIWSCWTEWTSCSDQCLQVNEDLIKRTRKRICKVHNQDLTEHLCTGETFEEEDCNDNLCSSKQQSESKGYQLIHVILVGISLFTISSLSVVAAVCIYFSKKKSITKHTEKVFNLSSRRPFLRESYSPTQQSPVQSPIEMGWYPSEHFNSIQRSRRQNASLINIPMPSVRMEYG